MREIQTVNLLPPSILLRIFTYFIVEKITQGLPLRSSPLDLAWVCRRWRSLVFKSPSLWPMLLFRDYEGQKTEDLIYLLSRYTTQFPATPLVVDVTLGHPLEAREDGEPQSEHLHFEAHRIISLLVSHQHRFRSVKLQFNIAALLKWQERWRDYDLINMPALEELDLLFPCDARSGHGFQNTTGIVLTNSPRLRSLKLFGNFLPTLSCQGHPSLFKHLTDVVLDGVGMTPAHPTLQDCLHVLEAGSNITSFRANICAVSPRSSMSYNHMTRTALRTLAIGSAIEHDEAIRRFLCALTAPALETLTVTFPHERSFEENRRGRADFGLPEFLERSCCSLKGFTSEAKAISEEELISILELSSDLSEFTIRGAQHLSRRLIRSLTAPFPFKKKLRDGLCEKLVRLSLHDCVFAEGGDALAEQFAFLLEMRWQYAPLILGKKYLKSVCVENCGLSRIMGNDAVREFSFHGLSVNAVDDTLDM